MNEATIFAEALVIEEGQKRAKFLYEACARNIQLQLKVEQLLKLHENATEAGQLLGTARYMSPEQAMPSKEGVGPSSDVYSLGVILFELLSGQTPFDESTYWEILRNVCEQEPPGIRSINSNVPSDLESICLKCLDKNPVRRYASAKELAEDLRRFLERRPVLTRQIHPVQRVARWISRNPVTSSMLTAICLPLFLVGFLVLRGSQRGKLGLYSFPMSHVSDPSVEAESTGSPTPLAANQEKRESPARNSNTVPDPKDGSGSDKVAQFAVLQENEGPAPNGDVIPEFNFEMPADQQGKSGSIGIDHQRPIPIRIITVADCFRR